MRKLVGGSAALFLLLVPAAAWAQASLEMEARAFEFVKITIVQSECSEYFFVNAAAAGKLNDQIWTSSIKKWGMERFKAEVQGSAKKDNFAEFDALGLREFCEFSKRTLTDKGYDRIFRR